MVSIITTVSMVAGALKAAVDAFKGPVLTDERVDQLRGRLVALQGPVERLSERAALGGPEDALTMMKAAFDKAKDVVEQIAEAHAKTSYLWRGGPSKDEFEKVYSDVMEVSMLLNLDINVTNNEILRNLAQSRGGGAHGERPVEAPAVGIAEQEMVRRLKLAADRRDAAALAAAGKEMMEAARHGADSDARIGRLVAAGAVPELVHALSVAPRPSEAVNSVVGAIKNVACGREDAPKGEMIRCRAVPPLVEYLDNAPTGSAAADAARALWNIGLARSPGFREEIVQSGAVVVLVRAIHKAGTRSKVADCAVGALKSIACGEPASEVHKDRLVGDGVVPTLLKIVQDVEPESRVVERALRALWHISTGLSDARRIALVQSNAIDILIKVKSQVQPNSEAEKCASGALKELERA